MQLHTNSIYRAFDADNDIIGTAPTMVLAKQAIRDHFETDRQRRDLGTLATEMGGLWTLPFSRCGVETAAPEDNRETALALALGVLVDEVEPSTYANNSFDADGGEWLVLTSEETQELALEQCKESAWAFNATFLSEYLPEGGYEALEALQSADLCEGANPAVIALLGDRANEAFMDAIACDGAAHFLAHYDGEEREATVNGNRFYIYRTN